MFDWGKMRITDSKSRGRVKEILNERRRETIKMNHNHCALNMLAMVLSIRHTEKSNELGESISQRQINSAVK